MQWSMGTDPANPNGGLKKLFSLLLTKPDYSLLDVCAWLRGFAAVRDAMFAQFMRFDARAEGTPWRSRSTCSRARRTSSR